MLAVAATFLVGAADRPAAEAQQAQRIAISVSAELRAEPASRVPFPIEVGPEAAIAKNSFVRIRGLPVTVALTEGHAIAAGAWAVPLHALSSLQIILPVGLEGRSEVSVSLVSIDGTVLAATRMNLVVTAVARPATTPDARSSPALGLAAPPPLSPADRERALAMHAKGIEQTDRGNIYAARKFFERAAEIGLAQSAVAAAATYDPNELARLRVIGLQPDVEAARKWYERARQLGAPEAEERLRRLR